MSNKLDNALEAAYAGYEKGDIAGAESACAEILRKAPRNTGALRLRGTLRLRLGDAVTACMLFEKVARLRPGDPQALTELAEAQLAASDYAAAEATLRRAMKIVPKPSALLQIRLGHALTALGRHDEAEDALNEALRLEPTDPDVLLSLANWFAERARIDEARRYLLRAADIDPERPEPWFNLAILLERERRFEEAAQAYVGLTQRFPHYHDAYINLGTVYERLGYNADAIRSYQQALAIDPHSVHALTNLGKALRSEHRIPEAKAACLQALRSQPDFVDAIVNLAAVLAEEGDAEAALATYEKALELDPRAFDAHLGYATLSLAMGDLTKGWRSFAWRPTRLRAHGAGLQLARVLPATLADRDVLLLGEQGPGDELFFLRYSRDLKARGARLHVQCDARLKVLLAHTGLYDSVLGPEEPLPCADLTVITGDLPLLLESVSYPASLGLSASAECVSRLRDRLAALGPPPYIGITWRAGTHPRLQSDRPDRALYKEVPHEVLAAALNDVPGTLVALQRQAEAGELERLSSVLGFAVHDLTPPEDDLEETLALLAALDEYVGVSNTNMHLIAGLGRSARVLVPHPPEWRWMWTGAHTPWFPEFEIYRQVPRATWATAAQRLREDLMRAQAGNKASECPVGVRNNG